MRHGLGRGCAAAPGRLSTITGCPSLSPIGTAITRDRNVRAAAGRERRDHANRPGRILFGCRCGAGDDGKHAGPPREQLVFMPISSR
jgi:hypothetical protein